MPTNERPLPSDIATLLWAHAQAQAEAPALLAEGRTPLSYAGLWQQARALSRRLQALGIGPGSRVAISLPNGPEMASAFVGVAAHAACVPLNPALPSSSLRATLQQCKVDLLMLGKDDLGPAREAALSLGLPCLDLSIDLEAPAGTLFPPLAADLAGLPPTLDGPAPVALLLQTSGTTGIPKRVPLTQGNLIASASRIARHLALTPQDTCLNVMPLFHIHGLVGALLATLAGGGRIVCTGGFDAGRFFEQVAHFEPSWFTAVPTIHQAVLAQAGRYRALAPTHRFRFVRSSSAALSPATLQALEAALQAPLIEAYGMTEASHQMASNPLPPARRLPGSVGVAAGAELAILDAQGRPLGQQQVGEICTRGPGVMHGYEGAEETSTQAFHGAWFRTGDLGRIDADGHLFVTGRLKDIVNRGGEKVSPREVDDALLEHPAVAQAAAFGVPHPSLGEDLAAAVVLRPGVRCDEATLRAFLFDRLAPHQVPSQIVAIDQLPLGETGKVQRHALAHTLNGRLRQTPVVPEGGIEVELGVLWREVLEGEAPGRHDNFFARGGDSLSGARVMARVNARWRTELPAISLFRHPTIAELAAVIDSACAGAGPMGASAGNRPARRADVNTATAKAAKESPLLPQPGVSGDEGHAAPCSHAQAALWVIEQLGDTAGAYHIPQAVHLVGPLDLAALQQALSALVHRHAALRTRFEAIDGVPVQHVDTPPEGVELPLHDASADSADTLLPMLAEAVCAPFDLTQGAPWRAALWRLGGDEHVLLLVVHHIVADGWSMQVIARDLGRLYDAARLPSGVAPAASRPATTLEGSEPQAPLQAPLPGPRREALLAHWRARLDGLAPLELPLDRPRPAQWRHDGERERFHWPVALTKRLHALARSHDVTLFMTLLAAFQVLLHRLSGQDDIAVGAPVAGRDRPELEAEVGYFVNSIVLRSDLSGQPRFTELLAQVRDTALQAYEHQALPFDLLVAALSPERDLSRNPLVQVSFALDNQPPVRHSLGGLQAQLLPLPNTSAKFDLSLRFIERDGALHGEVEYSTALFERATVQRWIVHLHTLLDAIADDPRRHVAELPVLSESQQRQIVHDWNLPRRTPADEWPVHERVRRQAGLTPLQPALHLGARSLSYGDLETQANRLAHRLIALGVGPEVMVGVRLERSFELVVALLAVLKAGGALVPLDPELPRQRLAYILADTRMPVLLTHSGLAVPPPHGDGGPAPTVWCADTQWAELDPLASTDPGRPTDPRQLAYVIYTSGSTGQPKGVLLEHRGWSLHADWMRSALQLVPTDRFVQITSIGFDAALVELFLPLQAGASLVLAPPGDHRDMAQLAALMCRQQVSVLQMVPSALRSMLAEPALDGATCLRHLICGGEALDAGLVQALRARLSKVQIGNFYGPTETSIDATHHALPEGSLPHGPIPIGRPVALTRCLVLDAHGAPAPIGVTGELHIGGAGLARGYLNQPELSARCFIADPFVPGGRLYRSGDLARLRADGRFEYLGRSDSQVKLRGHRIELGEIESALRAQPGVHDGAVLVREDGPGLQRLVAFVSGTSLQAAALRQSLAAGLPSYMVPGEIVLLDTLPTLPSGKIDRRALASQTTHAGSSAPAADAAPQTSTERAVADIWQGVLGRPAIGRQDHFFDLGGHSLLAMQVMSRLRAQLQVELPLRELFAHPTLVAFAAAVDRAAGAGATPAMASATPPAIAGIERRSRAQALPLSYSQRRMWLVQSINPQTTAYNMSLALSLSGALDAPALAQALARVVRRHEAFRTRIEHVGDGEPMQRIEACGPMDFAQIDLRSWPAGEREARARRLRDELAGEAFDLSRAGLYRIRLVQLDDDRHVLLWINHHVIGDHWSDGILLRETGHAYNAIRQGRCPALPALRIDYADYAAWQRDSAQHEALAPQMEYWTRKLQGLMPLPLPYDRSGPSLPSGRGSSITMALPAATTQALQRFGSAHGATSFMTMLACFKLLLWRCTGQTDIAVGSPIAGRHRLEAEDLVGTFVNTLVMRTELSGAASFSELLERVREVALDAFAHPDAPFDRLVEELRVDRSTARSPLVQVMFNVTSAPFDAQALDGLRIAPFAFDSIASQFDLGLTVDHNFGQIHLGYSTDVFVRASAERLLERFVTLLGQVLDDPTRELQAYTAIGEVEARSLREWNDTAQAGSPGALVHFEIEQQVHLTPHAIALRSGDQAMTYAGLDRRATQLARMLRARGVGRGSLVGLCVARGLDMVAALLAVLKAGAAYVPLDPDYPRERLEHMAQDAQLALLISEEPLRDRFDWPRDRTLLLDADDSLVTRQPETPLEPDARLDAGPEDPAYVIYTSGSTGRPKGVCVPHGAVVNFLASMAREPGLNDGDVLVAVTTLSFDIAVLELLLPLCVGAEVVLASREQTLDGHALRTLLEGSNATVMQATPSGWRLLLEAGWNGSPRFKGLIGGEALPPDLARQLLARCGALWNMYGPTETTVWSSCWKVQAPDKGIHIGRPIANTQVHILDDRGQRCPIGVPGEIYIGGHGVTLGYHERPELTAQRFVPDPFSERPQARLYRTGDRGRWGHDGQLEHLGRLDHQVKVRGHRIELGEIEAVLVEQVQLSQAVVLAREDRPGDVRLVAYAVPRQAVPAAASPKDSGAPAAAAMREHLRARLPGYMVPQHFLLLDRLPRLPNGKIDRQGLPAPGDQTDAPVANAQAEVLSPAETRVAEVWRELLGIDQVMRNDNFFDLGGHSLLAMRALHLLQERAGIQLELRRLVFETLAQIAATPAASTRAAGTQASASEPADGDAANADRERPQRGAGGLSRVLRSVRELIGG